MAPTTAVPLRRARVATAATFVAQGLMFSVLLTHLPQFTDKYAISEGTVTLVVLVVTVLAGAGSLLSEVLAGATSSRTALRCGLLLIAGAGALCALAPGLASFFGAFALYGLGVGAVDAAGNMQAVAVQHRYGRSIITSFHAAWSGAAIVGALYVAAGERLDVPLIASVLPAAAIVTAIAVVAGPLLLPPGRDVIAEIHDPAPGVGADLDADPGSAAGPGSAADPGSAAHPGNEPDPGTEPGPRAPAAPGPSVSVSVTRGPLLLIGLAMACFWAVDSGISNWSALYLDDVLLASGSTAALGYALYQALALASRLGGDLVVRRYGPVATVRGGALIGTAGMVIVVLAPNPAVAVLGFGLAGIGFPVVAPLCFSAASTAVLAGDLDSEAADGVVARLNVFNYLGSLLGAGLIGVVATVADLRAGFVVAVLLAAAVLGLARAFAPPPPATPALPQTAEPDSSLA